MGGMRMNRDQDRECAAASGAGGIVMDPTLAGDGVAGSVSRRRALAIAGGGLLAVAGTPGLLAHAATVEQDRRFKVYRKGSQIGTHSIRFSRQDDGSRLVHVDVDLAVKVAFMTLFRYRQEAEDRWRDGVLVGARVQTNDDGKSFQVAITEQNGRLAVDGPHGAYQVDLGIMTDLSFWNENIVRLSRLIDAKDGELGSVRIAPGTSDSIEVGGQRIQAQRFSMAASRKRSGMIWYDETGAWVKASLNTRGELLDYELDV